MVEEVAAALPRGTGTGAGLAEASVTEASVTEASVTAASVTAARLTEAVLTDGAGVDAESIQTAKLQSAAPAPPDTAVVAPATCSAAAAGGLTAAADASSSTSSLPTSGGASTIAGAPVSSTSSSSSSEFAAILAKAKANLTLRQSSVKEAVVDKPQPSTSATAQAAPSTDQQPAVRAASVPLPATPVAPPPVAPSADAGAPSARPPLLQPSQPFTNVAAPPGSTTPGAVTPMSPLTPATGALATSSGAGYDWRAAAARLMGKIGALSAEFEAVTGCGLAASLSGAVSSGASAFGSVATPLAVAEAGFMGADPLRSSAQGATATSPATPAASPAALAAAYARAQPAVGAAVGPRGIMRSLRWTTNPVTAHRVYEPATGKFLAQDLTQGSADAWARTPVGQRVWMAPEAKAAVSAFKSLPVEGGDDESRSDSRAADLTRTRSRVEGSGASSSGITAEALAPSDAHVPIKTVAWWGVRLPPPPTPRAGSTSGATATGMRSPPQSMAVVGGGGGVVGPSPRPTGPGEHGGQLHRHALGPGAFVAGGGGGGAAAAPAWSMPPHGHGGYAHMHAPVGVMPAQVRAPPPSFHTSSAPPDGRVGGFRR